MPSREQRRMTTEERFWTFVDKSENENDCWLWKGHANSKGKPYGRIHLKRSKRSVLAHRLSWEIHRGPIPDQLQVLHKCDVHKCVNPDHLFLGNNNDNVQNKVAKGRQPRGEEAPNVKLTEAQVREIRKRYVPYSRKRGSSSSSIARDYGICTRQVVFIAQGKNWKHVTDDEEAA